MSDELLQKIVDQCAYSGTYNFERILCEDFRDARAEIAQLREQLVKAETRISEMAEYTDALAKNAHKYQFLAIDYGNQLAASDAEFESADRVVQYLTKQLFVAEAKIARVTKFAVGFDWLNPEHDVIDIRVSLLKAINGPEAI